MTERVGIVGLGYVGLPVALAFGDGFPGTVGFDIDAVRVAALRRGEDVTGEIEAPRLRAANLLFSSDPADLKAVDVFVVCVPTPIHADRRPDLRSLQSASETIGRVLRPGCVVVYESTVYPGVTEEVCGPILARVSGLRQGLGFKLGYSPERINPGDKEHTFERIRKVVAGEDPETTERLASLYERVVPAGVHRASSLKVAEAAKVIENIQRDLNVALMNELAVICDLLDIRTQEVLEAAGTKWNFLPFRPGLVGGHCIGVDPYYLTSKAQELGYHPEVILSGRRINDAMGEFIAQRTLRFLSAIDRPLKDMRVGILGVTFKENVPDIRNSRVPDIIRELAKFGIRPMVADAMTNPAEVLRQSAIALCDEGDLDDLDALILAVPHATYLDDPAALAGRIRPGGVLIDVKSAVDPKSVDDHVTYWSL